MAHLDNTTVSGSGLNAREIAKVIQPNMFNSCITTADIDHNADILTKVLGTHITEHFKHGFIPGQTKHTSTKKQRFLHNTYDILVKYVHLIIHLDLTHPTEKLELQKATARFKGQNQNKRLKKLVHTFIEAKSINKNNNKVKV